MEIEMSITANLHNAAKARADTSGGTDWLALTDRDGTSCVSIFMPYQVAVDMAAVFNAQFGTQAQEEAE